MVAAGPNGTRTIPIDDFFLGLFTTALEPDEILTEIRIPVPPPRTGGAYVKLERKVGDFATAAAAAQVTLSAGGEVEKVGIGLTNAGPVPLRAADAESLPDRQAAHRRGDRRGRASGRGGRLAQRRPARRRRIQAGNGARPHQSAPCTRAVERAGRS